MEKKIAVLAGSHKAFLDYATTHPVKGTTYVYVSGMEDVRGKYFDSYAYTDLTESRPGVNWFEIVQYISTHPVVPS